MEQISIFDGTQDFKIDKPIRLIELFGGIGSQAKALENLGADFEHYRLCEFDKYAVASYNAVHHTNFVTSDITKISAADLAIVDTDKYEYIMTYSFPCQDLSNAGLGKGMDKGSGTRSGLLWEVERLLNECTELPQVLVMENVPQVHAKKNMANFTKWINVLESKGYKNYWKDLNAKNYGIPQNRNRCFMVSILGDYNYTFAKGTELKLHLKDLLEDTVDEKFYLSDKNLTYILDCNRVCDDTLRGDIGDRVVNPTIAKTISCRGAANQRADITNFVVEGTDKVFTVNELRDSITNSPKVRIKNGTKLGYLEAEIGDGIDLAYPDSKCRRGRVQKGMTQTVTTSDNLAVMIESDIKDYRIRKLTPKECWRLRGFSDTDFDNAAAHNSNAQLYKQAGNSIVVNVLMSIFKEML